jgi:hypothetical protein
MKATLSLLLLLVLALGFQQAYSQLDTLYFDDFEDERPRPYTLSSGGGSRAIHDALADASDTVVYEIRMRMDSVLMVGPAFFLNYTKPHKQGKKLLCCYQAVVVNPKDVHSYRYRRGNGGPEYAWAPKDMNLDRQNVTFRVTYTPSGFVHFDWNGARMHSQKQPSPKKNHEFRFWGWVSRGNAKYCIDYVCVLGRAKVVSGTTRILQIR